MKKIAFLFLLFCIEMSANAQDQEWIEGKFMVQALAAVLDNANNSTETSDYGYCDGICFMGAWIDESGYCTWEMTLNANTSYQFWGGGDNDAVDLDISVSDKTGKVLVKDKDADNSPSVYYTPTVTGTYTIKIELFNCASMGSFCAMATLEKGANTIPVKNIISVMKDLWDVGEYYVQEEEINLHFMKTKNQWSVYGAVINNAKESSVYNIVMGMGERHIVALGDENALDVDVILKTYPDGKVVCSDEEADEYAWLECETNNKDKYQIKIKNAKSDGKSLIVASIFAID